MSILSLGDDLLCELLRRVMPASCEVRLALASTCKRWAAIMREAETLWLEIFCNAWPTTLPGIGVAAVVEGQRVCPISIGVTPSSLAEVGGKLKGATELLLLAYRHSVSKVAVRSLQLRRHTRVSELIPGLSFHIAASTMSTLLELSLCQCMLPVRLGMLIRNVRSLKLWECPLEDNSDEARQQLVDGLASVPLETLVWAGRRHRAPLELLETPLHSSLRSLAASVDQLGWEELQPNAAPAEGAATLWPRCCGEALEQLVLFNAIYSAQWLLALHAAIAQWTRSLRMLQLAPDTVSQVPLEALLTLESTESQP